MRVADEVYYDNTTHTSMLPFTTSVPGSTNNDPMLHNYLSGAEIADNEFTLLVGQKEIVKNYVSSPVSPCYPNPFRESASIRVNLEKPSSVSVKIMNVTGQSVETTDRGILPAGTNTLAIDGRGLTPGLYFYTVMVNGGAYSGKMIVR
jgi:hypothetical protein